MTVTTTTPFVALWRRNTPCYLNITHLAPSNSVGTTRVRVDSLSVAYKGVAFYVRRVFSSPRSYGHGIKFGFLLNDLEHGCRSDCVNGEQKYRWACNIRNAKQNATYSQSA